MSLNLWKAAGKPTAYNPLPAGWNNNVSLGLGERVMSFKAKSDSGAVLRIVDTSSGGYAINEFITLTNELKSYKFTFISNTYNELFGFNDRDSKGDIIITDIELVEKPLPKLTVNGIDGFLSGKWSMAHAYIQSYKFLSDEEVEITTSNPGANLYMSVDVLPYTVYSVSGEGISYGVFNDGATNVLLPYSTNKNGTFNTGSNTKIRFYFKSDSVGTFIAKRPMLNLGSVPAPYEKKRGDKMVEPVSKKNLFDGVLEYGIYDGTNGTKATNTSYIRSTNAMRVKPNETYFLSNSKNYSWVVYEYASNGAFLRSKGVVSSPFTLSSDAYLVTFRSANAGQNDLSTLVQLEQGTTATPYEPYAVQMNKRPVKPVAKQEGGLRMDGTSNYLQLPSMTMDSIEIDCSIDSVQPKTQACLVDARVGLGNSYVASDAIGSGWASMFINDIEVSKTWGAIPKNQKTKVKLKAVNVFADDTNIFSNNYNGTNGFLKGILYAVRCYLNGAKVYELDFTNPNSVVGDKVLQQAKNLIPSFEDSRWQLHANARVYGRDVLRLEATAANQKSLVEVQVNPNSNYLFTHGGLGVNGYDIYRVNSSGVKTWIQYIDKSKITYNTSTLSDTVKLSIEPTNGSAGTFDFIKPQLYELSGKEGTVYGAPTSGLKPAKRTLYNRR